MDGTFSSVNVKIKECEDDGKLISISVENVLNSKKSVEHFLKNIFPKVVNNKEEHVREKAMFYNCVKNIFCHLGKDVILQMDYKEMVEDNPTENVSCTSLRMGATTTWHGYPDGQVRGDSYSSTDLIYSNDEVDDVDSAETCLTALNELQGDSAFIY